MQQSNYDKVKRFHKKYGLDYNSKPTIPKPKTIELRKKLIMEEIAELIEAITSNSLKDIAKELADSLYVLYGTAVSYGLDIDEIFDRVHKSNMTKSHDKTSYGKIKKGSNYIPPSLEDLV